MSWEGIEVEAKARIKDPDKICQSLLDRGAEYEGDVLHNDLYLSHPSRDFASTDEALRIRTIERDGERSYRVTYKGPKLDTLSKTRREVEISVESGEVSEELFKCLKFKPVARVVKKRKYFSLPPLKITVDHLEDIGWFIEVEARAGEEWERAREGVLAFLNSLGCGEQEMRSYLELFLEKENTPGQRR